MSLKAIEAVANTRIGALFIGLFATLTWVILARLALGLLARLGRNARDAGESEQLTSQLNARAGTSFTLLTVLLGHRLLLPELPAFAASRAGLELGLNIACLLAGGWCLLRSANAVRRRLDEKFDISAADNLRSRSMRTQIAFIERIFDLLVFVATFAFVLGQFEGGRQLSTGLLASAGVASLVIGLAAQRTIANLIAGFQIAVTQSIRIDDAVVVEDEWGWIEEISLTHVVVRIWDRRRLILPITYFVEKPFQNWTRKSGQILGSVFIDVAHQAPFEPINQELNRLLDEHPLWDGDARVLQVVESEERFMRLRALMTARNSPDCWDLRCAIRRGLVEFLVQNYPACLPRTRIALECEGEHRKDVSSWIAPLGSGRRDVELG